MCLRRVAFALLVRYIQPVIVLAVLLAGPAVILLLR
jgi:hypothetical protein